MAAQSERLPKVTAALVMMITGLEVFRDLWGQEPCSERGLGAYRRKLGPAPIKIERHTLAAVEVAKDEVRVVLAGICALCPHKRCRMKRWGVI